MTPAVGTGQLLASAGPIEHCANILPAVCPIVARTLGTVRGPFRPLQARRGRRVLSSRLSTPSRACTIEWSKCEMQFCGSALP
jgi:hypothetical protein